MSTFLRRYRKFKWVQQTLLYSFSSSQRALVPSHDVEVRLGVLYKLFGGFLRRLFREMKRPRCVSRLRHADKSDIF